MRKKVIIGNWKMNKVGAEAVSFIKEFDQFAKSIDKNKIILGISSPYLWLKEVNALGTNLMVSAQNVHFEASGAFTGEISIPMLKDIGVKSSLVGHSERRTYFNETNQTCNKKLLVMQAHDMIPVYCFGETLAEYQAGKSKAIVEAQLKEGLNGLNPEFVKKTILAYEPVWSIGTGINASVEIAQDLCSFVRKVVKDMFGADVASNVIIQYGGSVKPENAKSYLSSPDIDGVLVGGASLKVESFIDLVKTIL
jgi:triosephosphate isomerase (TIM)